MNGAATDHVRRRWVGVLTVLLACVFAAGILAALAARMERHEAVLDRRGRTTVAVVRATDDDRFRFLPDIAAVRYEHDLW